MKKAIIIFALLLGFINLIGQEHLSFKGIPIEGSMNEFCQKLKAKGFTSIGSENNLAIFKGDFTGRNATIGVSATDDGKSVYGIDVTFKASQEWSALVDIYGYYKDLYTRKYGKPNASKELNPAYSKSNSSLMLQLYQGTVEWHSIWKAQGGYIELSIEKIYDYSEGVVVIRYRDSQNVEAKIQKDLEEI